MTEEIKYSNLMDSNVPKLNDISPERLIRVYPYEMPNTSNSEQFLVAGGASIVYIKQPDNTNKNLKEDENGFLYFEMLSALTNSTKLDLSVSTSTLGQELKEEVAFIALANWMYEGSLSSIQTGKYRFVPVMCTIGKPFDDLSFEKGEQPVYVMSEKVEAKEQRAQFPEETDKGGLYEFSLANISILENDFENSIILFTEDDDIGTQKFDINNPPIQIEFENHTLISGIKGKGITKDVNSSKSLNEFSNIDLYSKQPLTPIKMTPISTQDEVTMYADWFDYLSVLPWFKMDKFTEGTNRKNSIKQIVTNDKDYEVLEKMIVMSAGYADSWAQAPRLDSGGDAGKINPTFKILDISIVALENKDPVKVIDGIYESHLRNDPAYSLDTERQRNLRGTIAALSRYIYSSYSIGKGQNAYNSLYLPWYFTLAKSINYSQYDKDVDIEVFALTNYFKDNFTSLEDFGVSRKIELPSKVNLSNQILLMSDRPSNLPELPYTINAINKLPLPGDINTKSTDDLSYLFYLPISNIDDMRKIYVNSPNGSSSKAPDQDFTTPAFSVEGTVTQAQANQMVIDKHPGSYLKKAPIIQEVKTPVQYTQSATFTYIKGQAQNGVQLYNYVFSWPGEAPGSAGTFSQVRYKPQTPTRPASRTDISTAIGEADVVLSSNLVPKNFGVGKRELEFDKDSWENFIYIYSIVPDTTVNYELELVNTSSIVKLDELIISSIWGNYFNLKVGIAKKIKIPMFNKDDETVSIQRVIFT